MTRASNNLSPQLHDYLVAHSTPVDEVLADLAAETQRRFPDRVSMQIGPEQGLFMTLLARLSGARDVVEVGTFTGYSSICLARGLPADGTLLACDVSKEWTDVARAYWQRAGVADKIELRVAPAIETLRALPEEPQFDLAFIDADKEGYISYWDALVPRVRSGGALLVDNVFSRNRVLDPAQTSPSVQAIRDFNAHARADDRTEAVLLPLGDGLTLARKK